MGIDLLNFAEGEPDFSTPQHIKDSAYIAMQEDFTKYTAVEGIEELRSAICEKLKYENNVYYNPSQIIVSSGAKQALFNAFMALCDRGDQVLLPVPCFSSYMDQIKITGATPVLVPTDKANKYRITANDLRKHFSPKVKAVVLNSPCNPSGAVIERDHLEEIAEFVVEQNIWVITDEVYEKILHDNNEYISIASLGEAIKKRTITINGLSKTYAMTGWRLGYAAGPEDIIAAMAKIQTHATSNANSIAQKAAIAALSGPQEPANEMAAAYSRRMEHVYEGLNSLPGVSCLRPAGGFYAFACIQDLYGARFGRETLTNETEIVTFLLTEANIAVVPGEAFYYPGYFRFCFATSMDNISKGLDRMDRAFRKLEF
ncbi:MAG: pyridoxal phosphate-dependent aminotransferase [Thermodesulfobacteriota bacterium]